ncbi:hypothetical protein AJ87_29385 [Rhizobium yanglingense]|nr:hypothetical protein AJ87_29385 [Rhizobium yanglingense]
MFGPSGKLTGTFRSGLIAAMLAGEETTRQRAPDENPEPLIDADGQQLVFGVAGFERIVDLLADEALALFPFANAEGLHDVPA